jgi:SAM-dependent methyltransferase
MDQQDAFLGSPWNAEPAEDWNQPAYWGNYYQDLLAAADRWRVDHVVHRQVDLLIRMLTEAGELPRRISPRTVLDAGCGIALIPRVLAFWGFQVTAIDSCPRAIEVAARQRPSATELARCVQIWEACSIVPGAQELVEDPGRSLQRLCSLQAADGLVTCVTGDWLSADLPVESFAVVHCRNSLRCSTRPFWRRSLRRFYRLLAPGGVLILENVNAIEIQYDVEELLLECGFVPLASGASRGPPRKYAISMWPTG